MSTNNIAIKVENISKVYRLGIKEETENSLLTSIAKMIRSPVSNYKKYRSLYNFSDLDFDNPNANTDPNILWALRNVSFDVNHGELVGIIGRNGAGKSTLLKILSRITPPARGRVEIHGRTSSLLEVGTGFHNELTGRENVYLNGTILGMRKKEVDRKFDEIVDFSGVEKFLDTPVKRYSSGMRVRLAFAVAAHLEPEILLVDEVLAVGDAEFQRKCLGKLDDIAQLGRTVLFVSHNVASVQRLCKKAMLLEGGRLADYGPVAGVIKNYLATSTDETDVARFRPHARRGTGWARIADARLVDESGKSVGSRPCDKDLTFVIDVETRGGGESSLRGLVLELMFFSFEGTAVMSVMNVDDGAAEFPSTDQCRMRVRLPAPTFMPGRYRLKLFLGIPFLQHIDDIDDALTFEISPPEKPWRPYELQPSRGVVCPKADWTCETPARVPEE